ncbi:hypothetical protein BTVI_95607 [Pitangus sulphuratus]|nr:hypothetical protein BTVI_95607 [Pitangus sulphuratus]
MDSGGYKCDPTIEQRNRLPRKAVAIPFLEVSKASHDDDDDDDMEIPNLLPGDHSRLATAVLGRLMTRMYNVKKQLIFQQRGKDQFLSPGRLLSSALLLSPSERRPWSLCLALRTLSRVSGTTRWIRNWTRLLRAWSGVNGTLRHTQRAQAVRDNELYQEPGMVQKTSTRVIGVSYSQGQSHAKPQIALQIPWVMPTKVIWQLDGNSGTLSEIFIS